MNPKQFLAHFDRISEVPDAVPRLRRFILDLAVRGKLVEQNPNDEPATELLKRIREAKRRRFEDRKLKLETLFPPAQEVETDSNPPRGWVLVRMNDVLKLWNGYAFKSADFQPEGVPVIRIGDLQAGKVALSGAICVSETIANSMNSEVWIPPNALLIAMSGATTGKVAFNQTGRRLLLNQRVGRVEVFLMSTGFVKLFFETIIARNLSISFGSAIPNLSSQQINDTVIPLPPLAEQHRIVAKVDELMALCDRLQAAQTERENRRNRLTAASLQRLKQPSKGDANGFREHAGFHLRHLPRLTTRPEQIKQLRQTILNLAVRGQLVRQDPKDEPAFELFKRIRENACANDGKLRRQAPFSELEDRQLPFPLPRNWHWVRFGELIIGADAGWSPRSEGFPRTGDNWGVLKVSAVSWDKFLPEENKQLLPGITPPEAATVHSGDFLISRANTSQLVAKCVLVEEEPRNLILSDKIVRLQITSECNKKFLCMVNNHANHARSYYSEKASGTSLSMKNVSRDVIFRLEVPLPPLAEQQRIVDRVEQMLGICGQIEARINSSQNVSATLLDAVLYGALLA